MPAHLVLTTASAITCAPSTLTTHGGTVTAASTAKLRVDLSPVILYVSPPLPAGPNGLGAIAGCKTPASSSPVTKPCLLVTTIALVSATTKLTVNGIRVLTVALAGVTDGTDGTAFGSLKAVANQSRLTAT